jgi:hypothetical protein
MKAVILLWTGALPSKARCYNAGAGVQNTNTRIILGLKIFFCWAEGYRENRVEMLVTYRLFKNKQSTLGARREQVFRGRHPFLFAGCPSPSRWNSVSKVNVSSDPWDWWNAGSYPKQLFTLCLLLTREGFNACLINNYTIPNVSFELGTIRFIICVFLNSVKLHHTGSALSEEWNYRTKETYFSLQLIQNAKLLTQKFKFSSLSRNDAVSIMSI